MSFRAVTRIPSVNREREACPAHRSHIICLWNRAVYRVIVQIQDSEGSSRGVATRARAFARLHNVYASAGEEAKTIRVKKPWNLIREKMVESGGG